MSALLPLPKPSGDISSAMVELNAALDLESFWNACLKLVGTGLQHRSCSLFFNIVDFEPTDARHYVLQPRNPDYVPPTSLTISGPYLARHPQVRMYTYSQIASEDPDAARRRLAQEPEPEWNEFIHLAFWHDGSPEAVMSIHRPPDLPEIGAGERAFLEQLYPMVEAGLRRLRAMEAVRTRSGIYEKFLRHLPLSVLFVDGRGRLLFASAEGKKQCTRWNRALKGAAAELELPGCIAPLFMPGPQGQEPAPSMRLEHPALAGLAARIERGWHCPGISLQPYYLVTFVDSPVPDHTAELSQAALLVLQQLSPGERRVARLAAKGLRNEEIAEHLSRSRRTVEFQLHSIYRKLGISSRTQLARALV